MGFKFHKIILFIIDFRLKYTIIANTFYIHIYFNDVKRRSPFPEVLNDRRKIKTRQKNL
jgi:hypothetical protein